MNTSPDYVNRLSLFLAKMIHDGAYDAHTLNEDNELVYDPTKDDRFSHYFKMRDKYGMVFTNDTKYNKQRSLYLTMIDDFNAERLTADETLLTEIDIIPRAYTNKDRESIKTFTDTAYGYYDHERTPMIKHLPQGIIFGQFLTFWPAKMKYYLGKPDQNTKIGYYGHKYIEDENGKQYYYLKNEVDEDGLPITVETTEDTGVPAITWIGSKSEGLLYSLGYLLRDLRDLKLDETDPERMHRAMLALHDLLLGLFLMWIASLMMYDTLTPTKKDKAIYSQAQQYGQSIMMKSLNEFDPINSIFGAIKWTPAFVSILGKSVDSFKSTLTGETELTKFFRDSFKMLEVLPMDIRK